MDKTKQPIYTPPIYLTDELFTKTCAFTISSIDEHNNISMIFCHPGTGLSGVAVILRDEYKKAVTVNSLISMGDLFKLGIAPETETDVEVVSDSFRNKGNGGAEFVNYSNLSWCCYTFKSIDYTKTWHSDLERQRLDQALGPFAANFYILLSASTHMSQNGIFQYPFDIGATKKYTSIGAWKEQIKSYSMAAKLTPSRLNIPYSDMIINFVFINEEWYVFSATEGSASTLRRLSRAV